jgi:hypothetical protein
MVLLISDIVFQLPYLIAKELPHFSKIHKDFPSGIKFIAFMYRITCYILRII